MAKQPQDHKSKEVKPSPEEVEYQELHDTAVAALKGVGADVAAQLVMILADGQEIPIRGFVARPLVTKSDLAKPEVSAAVEGSDSEPKPANPAPGKAADRQSTPPQA